MIRLKELREEKGFNMSEMAKELGLAYTTYIGYEKGEREPNSERLKELANHFGVTVDYLVGRVDEKNERTHDTIFEDEAEIILDICDILEKLTEENLLIIKEHALFLLDRQKDAPSSTSKVG